MWRFYLAGVLITGFFILGIIAVLYQFWYITVPLAVCVIVLAVWLRRRQRARAAEAAAARFDRVRDKQIEIAVSLIEDVRGITPERVASATGLPLEIAARIFDELRPQTTKEAPRSPAEARPHGAKNVTS